jgi:hypothetical protein
MLRATGGDGAAPRLLPAGATDRAPAPHLLLEEARSARVYSRAEQELSRYVQRQLLRLIAGDEERLRLMRRDVATGGLTLFLPTRIDRAGVRSDVAEAIAYGVLEFLHPFGAGGPLAQRCKHDRITESQLFPTRFAHLVVKRQDRFEKETGRHKDVDWQVVNVGRASRSGLLNSTLAAASLAGEIGKLLTLV